MSSSFSFQNVTTLAAPWTGMAPLILGDGRCCERYLQVEEDGSPSLLFDLRLSQTGECWFHQQAIVWNGVLMIGFAQRVYGVTPAGDEIGRLELGDYFGGFIAGDDWLLVATAGSVVRIDSRVEAVWKSQRLALDGVVIHAVRDGLIYGDGEWDPPGGWKSFVLNLADGGSGA